MIHNLAYSVTFPNNGIELSSELSFQPGVTAVTGQNGTGKTFSASEMPRYMLFGKKALRGPASDYKNLVGSMGVTIGDETFQIERARKETVTDESGKIVATGADAVNKFIATKFGFGLDVFDAICSSNQKDSEKLTRLRPAERKQMIDEIVGLGQNEAVEKLCRDEAKQFRRDAETLRDTLIIPTEPTKPPTYRPSSEIAAELEAARNIEISRSELEKVIARAGPEPVAPVKIRHSAAELTALEDHERQRLVVEVEHRSLTQRIAAIPDVVHTSEQLDAAQEWLDYWDEVDRRGPQPTMLLETVEELLQQWHDHSAVEAMEEHEVTCPKCRHAFLTKGEVPPPPSTPMAVLWQERDRNLAWATPVARPEMDAPAEPLTRKELGVLRQGLAKQDEKSAMMAELSALVILEDHAQELRDSRVAAAEWNAYEREHAAWLQRAQASSDAAKALSELPVAPDIGELSAARTAAAVYESQQVAFVEAAAAAEKLKERISSKTAKAESYKSGAEALQRSRAQFKAFLAPSLGRVASSLLHQMTDGRLSSVIVDEEMNILVDGQEVSTLSGAQETIANIALRLALGRVLFSKVFPVFLGDEIDAYSDEEMVQSTALALGSLRSQLQQIILISHKQIDFADHHIEISKRPELERT